MVEHRRRQREFINSFSSLYSFLPHLGWMLGGVAGGRLDGNGSLLAEGKRWIWTPGHPVVNPDRLTPHGAVAVDPTCDARAPTYRLVFRILNARWSMVYVNTNRGRGNSILVSNLVSNLCSTIIFLPRSIWEREKDSTQEHGLFNELFISIGSTTLFNIEGKRRDSHLWEKHFLRLSLWRYDQWRDGYIQCLFRRATGKENNCFYLGESLRYIMDRSSLAIFSLAKWKPSWTGFDRERERERERNRGESVSNFSFLVV